MINDKEKQQQQQQNNNRTQQQTQQNNNRPAQQQNNNRPAQQQNNNRPAQQQNNNRPAQQQNNNNRPAQQQNNNNRPAQQQNNNRPAQQQQLKQHPSPEVQQHCDTNTPVIDTQHIENVVKYTDTIAKVLEYMDNRKVLSFIDGNDKVFAALDAVAKSNSMIVEALHRNIDQPTVDLKLQCGTLINQRNTTLATLIAALQDDHIFLGQLSKDIMAQYMHKIDDILGQFGPQIAKYKTQISTLTVENKQLTDAIAAIKAQHEKELQKLKDEYENKLKEYQWQQSDQQAGILNDINAQHEKELQKLKDEKQKEVQDLNNQLIEAKAKLNRIENTAGTYKQRYEDEYKQKAAQIEALAKEINAEKDTQQQQIDHLTKLIEAKDKEIAEKTAENKALKADLQRVTDERDHKNTEFTSKITDLSAKLAEVKKQKTVLTTERDSMVKELAALRPMFIDPKKAAKYIKSNGNGSGYEWINKADSENNLAYRKYCLACLSNYMKRYRAYAAVLSQTEKPQKYKTKYSGISSETIARWYDEHRQGKSYRQIERETAGAFRRDTIAAMIKDYANKNDLPL